MEKIFENYGIEIIKKEGKYIIIVDAGELVDRFEEIVVSEEDAKKAQESSQKAYEVLIKYKNLKRHSKQI